MRFPILASALIGASLSLSAISAFAPTSVRHILSQTSLPTHVFVSRTTEDVTDDQMQNESDIVTETQVKEPKFSLLQTINEKMGSVDESRIIYDEYQSGQVPRVFSSLKYTENADGKKSVRHQEGSVMAAAALITGTTVGAGVLALPQATAAAGFLPSSLALTTAWIYMTMSGLLIAELSLNRMGNSGKVGQGLLELYDDLGSPMKQVGSAAYFFLHYAMLVAYIAQGGSNLEPLVGPGGLGQVLFATVLGGALFAAPQQLIEKANNIMVLGVAVTFLSIVGIGAGSTDFAALIDPANQHPEAVVSCFPILFLSLVYQNVVPTVVNQLEGDRSKITKAVIGGTTLPFIMFLLFNGVVLGNVAGEDVTNPVALLQSGSSSNSALGPLVSAFSSLALTTSVIGFTYGLVDAWTDVLKVDRKDFKPALYAAVFLPPLALSLSDPDIFFNALDYGGAFGVSTLFLVLPPLMVWRERYGSEKPLMTKPMVPFGKIPLGSMWKAAATLILEQGAEKLGIIDFVKEHFLS